MDIVRSLNIQARGSTASHLRCMCPAVQQLERPATRHAALLRSRQLRIRHVTRDRRWMVCSSAGSGSNAADNSTDRHRNPTPNNTSDLHETAGWNAADGSGSSSAWNDNVGTWPVNADWGDTVNIGDWGEAPSVGQPSNTYSSNHKQQGGQHHSAENSATFSAASGTAESNGYTRMGHNTSNHNGSSSSSSSGDAYTPPFSQGPYTDTATGTFYGSNNGVNLGDSSSYYSDMNQQQSAASSWPFADASGAWQQQPQQQAPRYQGANGMAPLMPSDITLVGRRDADSMLPLAPSTDQARYYQPRTLSERLVQVMGSFGVSVVLSKSAVLAGPALLYPIWGPWIRAGIRNMQMYLRQFKCVGLWRAEVVSVQINTIPYAYRQTGAAGDSVTVTVGDPWQGGARTELTFPYQPGCEDIVEGEPAELLVLCQDDTFMNFKVVREVYLPQSGMWLSEYPFVDRDVFLDVSLAIERGRQAAAPGSTAAATGMYQGNSGYQASYAGGQSAEAAGSGAGSVYPDSVAAAADLGPGSLADWVVPSGSSSSTDDVNAAAVFRNVADNATWVGNNSSNFTGSSAAGIRGVDPGQGRGQSPQGSSGTYSFATGNGSSSMFRAGHNHMNASSSTPVGVTSSSSTADPATTTGNFLGEFAGVASQFGGAASQVTGTAAHVAADVASGVAAGVAAGLGWINSTTTASGDVPSSTTTAGGDSSNDTAVMPDVIIDSQGMWSPMGGYMNRGGYGATTSYDTGGYGQPFIDQGFTGVYQRDAAGFGTGRYAGPGFSQQGPVAAGFPAANGFNAAIHPGSWGYASPGVDAANSRFHSVPTCSSYGGAVDRQHDSMPQTNPS